VNGSRGAFWTLVRRPLLWAFVGGCTVSMWASGRLSARLVTDGIVSFAFIPAFQILSLALVYRRRERTVPFAGAVDRFFVGNTPWLLWLTAFMGVRAVQTPVQATAPSPATVLSLLASLVPVVVWSASIDLRFFRDVLKRPGRGAVRALILQRAIAWSCGTLYFFGFAIWPLIVEWLGA
jgi:hypothetical protein